MSIRSRVLAILLGMALAVAVSAEDKKSSTPPSPPLSAAESMKRFRVADDLKLDQVLAEPIVAQPIFLNFDERGRMWVVQYLQYPYPAGLKILSEDKFLRAVYDKVPPPPPHHFKGRDKITIHEDTDGDGIFDKHKTFVEGLSIVTSCVKGRGGLWVLNPPYLLFYPDKNNDDVPDGPPEVLLEGFGLEDTHSCANSLQWGPDGWLYACQGSTVTGHVKHYGSKEAAGPLDGPAHLALSPGDAPLRNLRRGRRQRLRPGDRFQGPHFLRTQRRRHARLSLRPGGVSAKRLQ